MTAAAIAAIIVPPVLGLLIALGLIGLNGFFVAAEFALVKVGATQFALRAKKGDLKAKRALDVVTRLDRYLSVTQFGITLASLGLGWLGEPGIEHLVNSAGRAIIGHELGRVGSVIAATLAFTLLTFGHVLLGELVPKLVALQRSYGTAVAVVTPLRVIYIVFRPLLFILEGATRLILRAMGLKSDAASEGTLSEEEILGVLAANASKNPAAKNKSELVERVLRFSTRTARHAMVPRVDVVSMQVDASVQEAEDLLNSVQYSRILLTKGRDLDQIAGYMYAKDFFLERRKGRDEKAPLPASLCREVIFAPEGQSLVDVLRSMQQEQTPFAVVVDEYGGTSGIVTMEDILEEIVGEIRDETDEETPRVSKVQNRSAAWDVDARATMEELGKLGVNTTENESAETVGTVVLERLGRLPKRGDKVSVSDNATAEVTAVRRRRIVSVRLEMQEPKAEGEA